MSDQGVKVDHRKTGDVKNRQRPLTPTDIRSFLRLVGYYSRFMEGFSSIASQLTTLTKKKVKVQFVETCEESSLELNDILTSTPSLMLPKYGENYNVYCGASRVSLGCPYEG